MSIENVIEKLNCATRCNPNATQVLVSEAIEMLAKLNRQVKQEPVGVITRIEYNDDFVGKVCIRWDSEIEPILGDNVFLSIPSQPSCQPPKEWLQAVEEFVRRCEAGEIQSKYTYKKFKALLEASKS